MFEVDYLYNVKEFQLKVKSFLRGPETTELRLFIMKGLEEEIRTVYY